jgi:Flp pilus assembly protein TadB
MQQDRQERSLGELFADLSREMSRLIREEVALAKTEMTQKASKAGANLGFIAAAGAIAYGGFLVLLATAVIALALVLSWWLSALIVGAATVTIGGALAWYYWNRLSSIDPVPKQTTQSLKNDKEWMKEQA